MNENILTKNIKTKKRHWNVAAELLKREQEILKRKRDSFQRDCYGSEYIVERMQLAHHLTDFKRYNAPVLDFNCNGDLLCAGCIDNSRISSTISLIDWARKKLKGEIRIENSTHISDVRFVNKEFYKNDINIVSAYDNGLIRHDSITPTGMTMEMQTRQLSIERHKLAKCPSNECEILSAATSGNIYAIDLRSGGQATPTVLAQTKPVGKFVKLHAITHHPFKPLVGLAYSDYNVRIFDKRKFDRPVHEICPHHLVNTPSFARFANCIFSFDGSEILANYANENIYLFNSENTKPGEFKQSIVQKGVVGFNNKIGFFGTKSEYIIAGNDYQCIEFYDKFTGLCEHGVHLIEDNCSVDCLDLKSHPNLPIVVVSLAFRGLSMLSPSSKALPFEDEQIS